LYLTPPNGTDFWTFYNSNRWTIDSLIDLTCTKILGSRNTNLTEDLKSDILLSLYSVLKKYDSSKSSINTYITNQIRYSAYHVLARYEYTRNGIVKRVDRHLEFVPLNTVHFNEDINDLDFREDLELIMSSLSNRIQRSENGDCFVFEKYLDGYSGAEIAKMCGVTRQAINTRISEIKSVARKVLNCIKRDYQNA